MNRHKTCYLSQYNASAHVSDQVSVRSCTISIHSVTRSQPNWSFFAQSEPEISFNITPRRTEVVIIQFFANCSPLVKTFRTAEEYASIYTQSRLHVNDTVKHLLLRCPGRSRVRRAYFGRYSREQLNDLRKKHYIQVLEFLYDEGLLASPGPSHGSYK